MTNDNQTKSDCDRAQAMATHIVTNAPLRGSPDASSFTATCLRRWPHRCPQYLEWLWEQASSVERAAARADVRPDTMSNWLAVFGIRAKGEEFASFDARRIRSLSPEDIGLEPLSEPEGSA
jgi:hypothetical protein